MDMATFFQEVLPDICEKRIRPQPAEDGFALPPDSLAILKALIVALKVSNVFEFGSGQSTRSFLEAGCNVRSVEDSQLWLNETVESIPVDWKSRLHAAHIPLVTAYDQCVPFRAWSLDHATLSALREAELILIDSPAYPPFREHALITSLREADDAVIVMDDANIPTVNRFCARLARNNRDLLTFYSRLDHGLYFIGKRRGQSLTLTGRGFGETVRAWRRFFVGAGRS